MGKQILFRTWLHRQGSNHPAGKSRLLGTILAARQAATLQSGTPATSRQALGLR